MTLGDLLKKANAGYPDGFLAVLFDLDTGEETGDGGDSLARFVGHELIETFNPDASDEKQLSTARDSMQKAIADLESVLVALGG